MNEYPNIFGRIKRITNEYPNKFALENFTNILKNEYICPKYTNIFEYQNICPRLFWTNLPILIFCVFFLVSF